MIDQRELKLKSDIRVYTAYIVRERLEEAAVPAVLLQPGVAEFHIQVKHQLPDVTGLVQVYPLGLDLLQRGEIIYPVVQRGCEKLIAFLPSASKSQKSSGFLMPPRKPATYACNRNSALIVTIFSHLLISRK